MNVVPSVIRVASADPVEDAMEIDSQLPIPLYFQLKTLLLEEILRGRYGPEQRLPTRLSRSLAENDPHRRVADPVLERGRHPDR